MVGNPTLIALNDIVDGLPAQGGSFYKGEFNEMLNASSITTVEGSEIQFREVGRNEDMTAFRTLNEEWISRFFRLEARDVEVLGDLQGQILGIGGHVYFADWDEATVGCVALIPMKEEAGVYELSKMAVSPTMRGRGIGRVLLSYVIGEARLLGARSLFLGSSTKLENAVHLYEAMGFRHVLPEELPHVKYSRADVFMAMEL